MSSGPLLPPNASAASQTRLQLARQLAARCPPSTAAAIALTGSSAHGLADAASDAEINHWAGLLPPLEARAAYLADAGVTRIEAEPAPRSDGSEWFQGFWGDIPVEVGWQSLDDLETSLRPLLTGETTATEKLRLGELLVSAVLLREDGRLLALKTALASYPDPLRDRLLAELSAPLRADDYWTTAEKLARRGERLTVVSSLAATLKTALRLCYTVNRRWEASDKWLLTLAAQLPAMPPDWRLRLDEALSAPPLPAVQLARTWCDDALSLSR